MPHLGKEASETTWEKWMEVNCCPGNEVDYRERIILVSENTEKAKEFVSYPG